MRIGRERESEIASESERELHCSVMEYHTDLNQTKLFGNKYIPTHRIVVVVVAKEKQH